MPSAVEVIINAASGSGTSEDVHLAIVEAFATAGKTANLHLATSGDEIERLAKVATENSSKVIVAAGGDGTISTVATHVYRSGKIFGVLPLGTLNNFSKDLGIPQELADAVKVIAEGHVTEVDLAEVNGRVFLNNSSIGLYPSIVRKRQQQQIRLGYGKWRAALWATLRIFRVARFLKVRIEIDGESFLRKTPFVFVGNNEYEMDLYNIGRRLNMDSGKLSIYFLHRGGRWGVIVLLFRTLTGSVRQWREFEQVLTESVTIQSRRKSMSVAFDGEIAMMEMPLKYKTLPKALRVIVPKPE